MEIARTRPDAKIECRHGFQVMVEDIGLGLDHLFKRAGLLEEIRGENLDGRLRARQPGLP